MKDLKLGPVLPNLKKASIKPKPHRQDVNV